MVVYLFQIKHFVAFFSDLKAADRRQNRFFRAETCSMDVYAEIKPARLYSLAKNPCAMLLLAFKPDQ
jgi:hypothetical protein